MPFAVTTPEGNVVRLDDVPLEDLGKIAEEAGLDTWAKLLTEPLRNHTGALAVYRYCCDLHSEAQPEKPSAKQVIDAFEFVADDLPATFEGGLPLEEAADGQTTSGSPGAPSASSGPPPSPEATPFANSNS